MLRSNLCFSSQDLRRGSAAVPQSCQQCGRHHRSRPHALFRQAEVVRQAFEQFLRGEKLGRRLASGLSFNHQHQPFRPVQATQHHIPRAAHLWRCAGRLRAHHLSRVHHKLSGRRFRHLLWQAKVVPVFHVPPVLGLFRAGRPRYLACSPST